MSYTLHHFEDAERLAAAAAERWRTALLERDPARSFTVALSGGRIPKALYKAFAGLAAGDSLEGVHFFWGDERVVPPTDPESNYHLAAVPLFLALKIPESRVHRMITERDEAFAVQQAEAELCRVAELNLQGQPELDLVFLGMGEDGHVASLFPGDTKALETPAVYRAVTGPKPPPRRITLGYPALAAAREVWVLASGEGKKEALQASLEPTGDTPLARVLQSRSNTEIFTDFVLA